jgi:hypothetical protein
VEHLAVKLDCDKEEENNEELLDTNAPHVDVNTLHHRGLIRPGPSHATSNQLDNEGTQVQEDKDHGEQGGIEDAYSTVG